MLKKRIILKAFTLLELMTVVVIIGVLAMTAIPLLNRYLKKTKTAEAGLNLRKIYDGEVGYYQEEHTAQSGGVLTKQFVSTTVQPSYPPGVDKKNGNFEGADWHSIKFGTDSPVQFCYQVVASGVGTAAAFTARGEADIDGDGQTSLFERVGSVSSGGDVTGGGAVFELDPLE